MIDEVLLMDKNLFILLNGLHTHILDGPMLFLSNSLIPIIIIFISFLFLSFKVYRKNFIIVLLGLIISFALSDIISSRVLKPSTKRLRPCHEINLEVYTAGNGCGGKYSFVSSHASNSFAVMTFIWLLFKSVIPFSWLTFLYAGLVSYSRIYLARHYPLDIFFGALLGLILAYLSYQIVKRFIHKNYNSQTCMP